MGKSEAYTALALGRGHYEDEVIWTSDSEKNSRQKYNSRGHPRNPETKKRERDHIRAANEVMLVTGVVEDTAAARAKKSDEQAKKQFENYIGFRLVEVGRACLYAGVWGVVGFRRRSLLYRSYATMSFCEIIRREREACSIPHLLFAGLPTMVLANISYIPIIIVEKLSKNTTELDENENSSKLPRIKALFQMTFESAINYFIIQLQISAILRQLSIIPQTENSSHLTTIIPHATNSLIQLGIEPTNKTWKLPLTLVGTILNNSGLLLLVVGLDRLKFAVSVLACRYIHMLLPNMLGTLVISDLASDLPSLENNASSEINRYTQSSLSNAPLATSGSVEAQFPSVRRDISDGEEDEMNQAHLISFDVEPTDAPESSRNPWSAELRSANDPKSLEAVRYRMTGLTVLPTILAIQVMKDVIADIFVVPLEALMLRAVGRAHRTSALLPINDLYPPSLRPHIFSNLLISWTLQLTISGTIWCGITMCTNWYTSYRQKLTPKLQTQDENN